MKSASKIGSSTSLSAAWTTLSATVGMDVSYCLSCSWGLGLRDEMDGVGDALTAGDLDCGGPRYAVAVSAAAVCAELAGVDPVVDDVDADSELFGGCADTDFACCVRRRCLDVVDVTDPLDGFDVEGVAVAGAKAGGGEFGDEFVVGADGSETDDHLGCGGRGSLRRSGRQRPFGDHLVGGAGVPADADTDLVGVGF